MSQDAAVSIQQDLLNLLQLQDRDVKIRRLEAELAQKPLDIEALKNGLSEHRKRLEAARENVKKRTTEKNSLEGDLESRLQNIQKLDGQSSQVKTNEEYRAMMKEIESLKKGNIPLEDKILEAMEKVEEEKKIVAQEEQHLKQEEAKVAEQERVIKGEIEAIRALRETIVKEREGLIAGVRADLLERYNLTFENKEDAAIVVIEHGACGGCHMAITPQIMTEVKRRHDLVLCENCARILYLPVPTTT